ncbi:MAG TPA: AraC family transcriptional regulator [Stellaceae bacterium]|nr:AraC family transcriptional regulator [Stellaceae bacterium]
MTLARGPGSVFQNPDFGEQKTAAPQLRAEFPRDQTHGIALWPKHRLLNDSRGLGWREAYTSLAAETSWRRTLEPVPHLCLAYCLHGGASVNRRIDGQHGLAETELRARLFGVVPEMRRSMWNLRGNPVIQLAYLRRPMVEHVAQDVLGLDPSRIEMVPRLGFADPLLEQLMLELLDAAREEDGGGNGLYADHLAHMIALRILRRHVARPGSAPGRLASASLDPRLRHVRELIETSLDEDLSLDRLAREAGVGAHAFSAAFLRAVGTTPHKYVLERRIERAKTLLRSGAPVADVALQTGFASQSHLAAAFKRAVGLTPGQYRRG